MLGAVSPCGTAKNNATGAAVLVLGLLLITPSWLVDGVVGLEPDCNNATTSTARAAVTPASDSVLAADAISPKQLLQSPRKPGAAYR